MRQFKRIKVDFIRQKPVKKERQKELVDRIAKYYIKALREKDEFMQISAIENLIFLFRRNEIGIVFYNLGIRKLDDADYLYE